MFLSSVSSRLFLHDCNNWDLKKTYAGYDGVMRDISWSDDGKYILQVNSKGHIEILSAAEQDIRSLQHIPVGETWSASFHRDGHRNVAIGTKTGNILIWDTKNKNIAKTFPTPLQQSQVNFVSYNAKNTSLAATMQNGDTVIYGLVSNIPVQTVKLSCSKSILAMKFHHESRALLGLATEEGHIVLRDIATNKDRSFFENVHASPASDFAFSLINKDVMLSCGYDKIMHVYDIRLQNVVQSIKTSYPLTSIAISPENIVALGTKNGLISIYDLRDLSNPLKLLRGHEDEVCKVAFQPFRKKNLLTTDISLREDSELISPHKTHSPTKPRTSDLFYLTDTTPNRLSDAVHVADNKADSFLAMMGLDNTDLDDEGNRTTDFERRSDKHELRYRQLDAEKNISKFSTPLNSRTTDPLALPSPICVVNGANEEGPISNSTMSSLKKTNGENIQKFQSNIDSEVVDELKDLIKLTAIDLSEENRSYFLQLMMVLTKQKLFLEKQLKGVNEQMLLLAQNQNSLLESNMKLALEIEKLKSHKNGY